MEDSTSSAENGHKWYVMRVTYQREVAAKQSMDALGVETYLPVQTLRRRNARGRFCKVTVPLVHNFLFVHSERSVIDDIKTYRLPYLRYATCVRDGQREIMVVPDRQMESFIRVVGEGDKPALFLDPAAVNLSLGDRVRIIDGPLAGVEGTFMRLQGGRGRRVVVKIDMVAAVATTELTPAQVEKI